MGLMLNKTSDIHVPFQYYFILLKMGDLPNDSELVALNRLTPSSLASRHCNEVLDFKFKSCSKPILCSMPRADVGMTG